jgi:predicted nucleic acid-binding protein
MTLYLDTNVPVRYFTGRPSDQFHRASRLLDEEAPLILTDVVAAEIAFVLGSVYKQDRKQVTDALQALMARANVHVDNPPAVLFATDIYRHTSLGFADAYLAARALLAKLGRIASFDKGIDKVPGVRVEP